MGLLYDAGHGVPKDYSQAAAWYLKAADQGNDSAQFNLGQAYADGKGVPQDYVLAHKWLNLSASRAKSSEVAIASAFREMVAKRMTAEQVADAQKLAREWIEAFEKRKK